MSSKLVFLLLSALFLVQCSVCKPMPDEALTTAVPEGEYMYSRYNGFFNKLYQRMLIAIQNQTDRFMSVMIDSRKYYYKKVVEELNAKEENSETVAAKVNELKDLTKRLDLVLNIDSLREKMLPLKTIAKDEQELKNSLDEKIIEDSIILSIMDKAEKETYTKYCENIKKECQKMEQLINPLAAKSDYECISLATEMGCANSDSPQN